MRGLVIIFVLIYNLAFTQTVLFEKLDITDGLPDNSVRDIIQDSRGYLWFGTLNGLSRYDGNNFKNYHAIPGDSTSLTNSRMIKIYEDKQGFIWSWAEDYIVQRINPYTDEVINVNEKLLKNTISPEYYKIATNGDIWFWGSKGFAKVEYVKPNNDLKVTIYNKDNGIENCDINFLFEDRLKNIWVGSNAGLIKINDKTNVNTYYPTKHFTSFYFSDEHVWFGTKQGEVLHFSISKKAFQEFQFKRELPLNKSIIALNQFSETGLQVITNGYFIEFNLKQGLVKSIQNNAFNHFDQLLNDAFGNTWLAFKNVRGVFKYSNLTSTMTYFSLKSDQRSNFGDPDKHQILEDSNKNIWVGIHGGGLFLYNREQNSFTNYVTQDNNSQDISSNIVLNLFEDASKNLWIGTMYGGVNKVNLTTDSFSWTKPIANPENIYTNEIRCAVQDKNNNVWLGSKGGKIFRYHQETLDFVFPDDLTQKNKSLLSNINVYSLFIDSDDNLWIGTKGKGLFIIKDILNTQPKDYTIVKYDFYPLTKVYSIVQDKYKNMWIGSHGNGLGLIKYPFFDADSKKEIFKKDLSSNYIRYLFRDKDDNIWIGTSDGLNLLTANQLNKSNKQFLQIKNNKQELNSISYNAIDHVFQGANNNIYVSTMGGGLNILEYNNLKTQNFSWKHITESNGVSSNKIFAVQEDNANNIWISTGLGLNKYYPSTNKVETFFREKKNGFNYFTESCALKLSNEALLFGSNMGFITFNPKAIIKDTAAYPLVLSKLFVNGNEIVPRKSKLIKKNIENETSINLTYTQNTVRLDFSVLDFKNPNKIQYSYKLLNYDENWSTPLNTNYAMYQNLPPGDYTFQLKATNSDGVELKKTLNFDINIAPPFYKSVWGYILEVLVLSLLIVGFLYLYKKQISAKQEVIFADKLNEKKLVYYTNISHEFKTPLTLVSCHVQDILNDNNFAPEFIKSKTKEIQKSTSYLLNLVEQILDFRKIREEKLELFIFNVNITEFAQNIYNQFLPLANQEGISLKFEREIKDVYGFVDVRILKKIIYNLLSNAIKFTPSQKQIIFKVYKTDNPNNIAIEVQDEGKGISEDQIKVLFERFSKSENSSGLGLSYVKELVDSHKGTIQVKSEVGKGTCFKITLPITKSSYRKEDVKEENPNDDVLTLQTEHDNIVLNDNETSIDETIDSDISKKSMLIIEDNAEMRKYLKSKFSKDYLVYTANNGKEGLDLALKEVPSIIICDLMMPVMDGIETIKQLKENFNTTHIPVILLTANSAEKKKLEGFKMGADDYINKPFNVEYLKFKVDVLISQRKNLIKTFSNNPELSLNIVTNSDEDKKFIEKVKEIVESSLGESTFSINYIASEVGMSRTQFFKKMKDVVGETPNSFIGTIQMKKAQLLLQETNYTISEISVICGFNDSRYFSKIFKKHYGKTPNEYKSDFKNKTDNP